MPQPLIFNCGDRGILLQFGAGISPKVNRRVQKFFLWLRNNGIPGIIEAVPGFRTLLIYYDPLVIQIKDLKNQIRRISEEIESMEWDTGGETKNVTIPIVFGGEFGPDLESVAHFHGIEKEEVIKLFLKPDYKVHMFAFAPGFPLLASVHRKIATPRLKDPRAKVPIGSVGIGRVQVSIYTQELPGGVQLIGRTPLKLYEPQRSLLPRLLTIGDTVRFKRIDEEKYKQIGQQMEDQPERLTDYIVGG
jgi:inhibitor of KinA